MDLKKQLEKYSQITESLIERTKLGEELESLLKERSKIINEISHLNFSKDEFQNISIEFKIFELEEEFQNQIKKEKKNIKTKIELIKQTTIARRTYENAKFRPTFFNKKG